MAGGQINFKVGYTVDKAGLNEIQRTLTEIITKSQLPGNKMNTGMQEAAVTARQLSTILDQCFNKNLGTLNINKFNQALLNSKINLNQLKTELGKIPEGSRAFNQLGSQILNTNVQLKQSSKLLDDMATTMANTVKWGIASSLMNTFTQKTQDAYNYVKKLDGSLNDIRIVTGKSADEMERFAEVANSVAKDLGAKTTDFTNATLIYYQQGLDDAESATRAEITVKTANITGQSADEVSEQLTAVWNGYKVDAAEAEFYVDKLAAVAASTASDLEELSTGMSKVASAANSMGVDVDQLNAQLATIISVTRQAPESVGTALKTIYARMGDLAVDGEDEFGVSLGEVSGKMAQMGIQITDQQGNLRDMGLVIEETAAKWDTWTKAQRQAAAVAIAGKRQYNNLIALFENWDMYTKALETSANAMGTLNKQNDIYLESTEAKLNTLRATWEDLYGSMLDNDEINVGIDALTHLVTVFDNFIASFGGGAKSITAFGILVANIFNKQISKAITTARINQQKYNENIKLLQLKKDAISTGASGVNEGALPQDKAAYEGYQKQLNYAKQIQNVQSQLTSEQYNELVNMQKQIGVLEQEAVLQEQIALSLLKEVGLEEKDLANGEASLEDLYAEHAAIEQITASIQKQSVSLSDIVLDTESLVTDEKSREMVINKINQLMLKMTSQIKDQTKEESKETRELKQQLTSQQNRLKNLNKEKVNQKDIEKIQERILNITKQIVAAESKIVKKSGKKVQAGQQYINAQKNREHVTQQQDTINEEFDTTINHANVAMDTATKVMTVSSALTSMTMAWSSMNSAIQIWTDESASFGEKLSQSLMTVGMLLPSLLTVFKELKTLNDAYLLSKEKKLALDAADLASIGATITAKNAEAGVTQLINIVKERGVTLTRKEAINYLLSKGTIDAETAAKLLNIKVTKELKGATQSLWTAMMSNPITAIIAALAAFVSAISLVVSAQEKAIEKNIEHANSQIELENATQTELKTFQDLAIKYMQEYEKYKKIGEGKDELKKTTNELIDSYDIEVDTIDKLTENYDNLTASIHKAMIEKAKEGAASAENEQKAAEDKVLNTARQDRGYKFGQKYYVEFSTGLETYDEVDFDEYTKNVLGKDTDSYGRFVINYDISSLVEFYDDLVEATDEMEEALTDDVLDKSELYQDAIEWIDKMEESIEEYKAASDDLIKYLAQIEALNINFTNIIDYDQFLINYNKLKEEIKNMGIDSSEARKMTELYISQYGGEQAQLNLQKKGYIEGLTDRVKNQQVITYETELQQLITETGDWEKAVEIFAKKYNISNPQVMNPHAIVRFQAQEDSYTQKKDIQNAIGDLSQEEFSILMTFDVDRVKSLDKLNDYIELAEKEAKILHLEAIIDITDSLITGKELTDEQIESLEELEAEYPKLAAIQDRTSKAYIDLLQQIQNEQEEVRKDVKIGVVSEKIEDLNEIDISVSANEQEFLDTMQEIAEAEYEVQVTINADIDSDFTNVISEMEQLQKASSTIGDNFIVAADDVAELGSAFPGILEGVQFLHDGTVKLKQQSVQTALDAAEAEMIANRQTAIDEINNEKQNLLMKQQAAQNIANLAKQIAEGEKQSADVQGQIKENLAAFETDISEEVSIEEQEDGKDVADASKTNATAMATNFTQAYQKMTEDSATWAKAATNNFQAATTGNKGLITTSAGKFDLDWSATETGAAAKEPEKDENDLSDWDGYSDKGINWEGVSEYYQNLADTYGKSANDADAKIAEIMAKSNESSNLFKNLRSGLGSDGKAKELDFLEDEKDIYHDINIEIQQLENSMEELQEQQDKLYGQDLLVNLQQQLNLLEKQEDAQRRKLAIAQQEAATLKSTLAGQGTTFNADGTIANYQALYDQKLAYVNSIIASGDEDAADTAQKAFEEWVSNVERYDELLTGELPEIDQMLRDIANQRIEKQIEAFEYEIQLKLDVKDAERDWNDFKRNMTIDEDDILGNTRFSINSFKSYLGDDGTITTLLDKNRELMDQYNQIQSTGTSSIYGDNMAALMEDMQENQEELMSAMEEQKDLLDEIEEAYVNMLDAAQEAFDEQVAQYEAINEVYSHGLNVINVLYGEDAYADMEGFYQKQMENNNQMIDMQRRNVEFYKKQLEDTTLTDEQREEVQRKLQEAQAALHSSVESQIDLIINKYTNAINKIFQELENKMTNGKGLSYIQEEWDLLNQNAEMYLDQINSAYEVEKLAREYNKAIDATDSLSAQRKLNELMEEQLKGLREKEKLTQYDVDRANALLDVELKRIALEEAQQNKSKMRLRRDASGNYSYQFVSDEEATAEAQQELADAQNSLYNLDKDALQENQEAALNMWTEFKDKYIEIMSDVTLTDEEREARLQQIREQYGEMYNNLLMQNEDIRKNLEASALDEMKELNLDYVLGENGLVPTWDSGVQQMMDKFAGEGGLLPTCSEAFGELSNLTAQYDADLATLEANAGYSLGNIAGYTAEVVTQMESVLQDNDELIKKYEEEFRQLELLRSEVSGLMGDYRLLTEEATQAANAILNTRQIEADVAAEKAAQEAAAQQQAADEAAAAAQPQAAAQQPSLSTGASVTVKTSATHFSRDGGNGTRMKSFVPGSTYAVMQVSGNEVLIGRGGVATGWVNKTDLVGFATGGYTGDWADKQGKLAVLHQKELVLNSQDTKNILQAVDIVRHIDGIMESIMGNAFNRVNAQLNGLNSMNIPVSSTATDSAIEQHIEINADFPGVEKASEIISAFENLTNMATQYAFKTDR